MSDEIAQVDKKRLVSFFPMSNDWEQATSTYNPLVQDVTPVSKLGFALSHKVTGLEHIHNNLTAALRGVETPGTIRFFQNIPDESKNALEKVVGDDFNPIEATEIDIFRDLRKLPLTNNVPSCLVLSVGTNLDRSLAVTSEQETSIQNVLKFIELSRTIHSDEIVLRQLWRDAFESEEMLKAVLMPDNNQRVDTLISLFCQRAHRNNLLAFGSNCMFEGCETDSVHKELFKIHPVCLNHRACLVARGRGNVCNCDSTFCRDCVCKLMSEKYRVSQNAVCPICNMNFCPNDLILYTVAEKPGATKMPVAKKRKVAPETHVVEKETATNTASTSTKQN